MTTTIPYVDDDIFDFLKPKYTTYRNGLPDPTRLPADTEIVWRESLTDIQNYSFDVIEGETTPSYKYLGGKNVLVTYHTQCFVVIGIRWTLEGKPGVLNEFREFLNITLNTNLIDQYWKDKGYDHIEPGVSRAIEPRNPETDEWTLTYQVNAFWLRKYSP